MIGECECYRIMVLFIVVILKTSMNKVNMENVGVF